MVLPGFSQWPLKRGVFWLPLLAAAVLASAGCGKKVDVQHQAGELEKAFPGLASVAPAQLTAPGSTASTDPRACVSAALLAFRTNDFATAVILLEKAIALPGVTPAQVEAAQATKKAWVGELMERAAKGAEDAKRALITIEAAR